MRARRWPTCRRDRRAADAVLSEVLSSRFLRRYTHDVEGSESVKMWKLRFPRLKRIFLSPTAHGGVVADTCASFRLKAAEAWMHTEHAQSKRDDANVASSWAQVARWMCDEEAEAAEAAEAAAVEAASDGGGEGEHAAKRARSRASPPSAADVEAALVAADEQLAAGDAPHALATCEETLSALPQDEAVNGLATRLLIKLHECHLALAKELEALKCLDQALNLTEHEDFWAAADRDARGAIAARAAAALDALCERPAVKRELHRFLVSRGEIAEAARRQRRGRPPTPLASPPRDAANEFGARSPPGHRGFRPAQPME